MFSDVWSENAALFKRLMDIYSPPPILYYGFKDFIIFVLVHVMTVKKRREKKMEMNLNAHRPGELLFQNSM